MGIRYRPNFKVNDIAKAIYEKVERVENVTLDLLQQIGEQFIIDARSTKTYKDRTRNLRGSIGYVILKDGEQIFGNFQEPEVIGQRSKGEEPFIGDAVGKKVAMEVGKSNPNGYVLVVVAGMNYAAYVEAKGYDVLTGSSLSADTNMKRAMARLQQRLKAA